ncbi:hypothetical protein ACKWTF_004914 [Chironomus riparius]
MIPNFINWACIIFVFIVVNLTTLPIRSNLLDHFLTEIIISSQDIHDFSVIFAACFLLEANFYGVYDECSKNKQLFWTIIKDELLEIFCVRLHTFQYKFEKRMDFCYEIDLLFSHRANIFSL